jgi:hypothetical protein
VFSFDGVELGQAEQIFEQAADSRTRDSIAGRFG